MPGESSSAIPILHEEPHFLLVNKPAGLFSQAANPVDSLQIRLVEQMKRRDGHPGRPFIGLPHRLDRGTSGIMLIAKNQRALKRFGEQFHSRKVSKFYVAVVEASLPVATLQKWEDFMRKIPDCPQAEIVDRDSPGAKLAVSNVKCLTQAAGYSLLLVQIETGRMHQIRLQCAARGWPVLGDTLYGASTVWESASELTAGNQPEAAGTLISERFLPIGLHALRLEFRHPQTAKRLSGTAEAPAYWWRLPQDIIHRLDSLTRQSFLESELNWKVDHLP